MHKPINKSLISQATNKKWKCFQHKENYRHLLHLNKNAKIHRICEKCKLENRILDSEILSIHDIFKSQETTSFQTYPILLDNELVLNFKALQSECNGILTKINNTSIKIIIVNQIQPDLFKLNKSLKGVMRESKELYCQITLFDKLKKLILSQTEQSEEELHNFIHNHISQAQTNSWKIQKVVERIQKIISHLSIRTKQSIQILISSKLKIHNDQLKSKVIINKIGIKSCDKANKEAMSYQGLIKFKELNFLQLNISNSSFYPNLFTLKLSQLTNLKSLILDISSNKIDNTGVESLFSTLEDQQNLITLHLDLKNNYIEDEGAALLSSQLSLLKNLKSLQLNFFNNKITQEGAISLSLALFQLKNLNSLQLNLSDSRIGLQGAESLSFSLTQLKNLNSLQLFLYNNNIGQQGAESLSLALSNLINLNSLQLNLWSNNIGQKGSESLSSALSKLKNLNSQQQQYWLNLN